MSTICAISTTSAFAWYRISPTKPYINIANILAARSQAMGLAREGLACYVMRVLSAYRLPISQRCCAFEEQCGFAFKGLAQLAPANCYRVVECDFRCPISIEFMSEYQERTHEGSDHDLTGV